MYDPSVNSVDSVRLILVRHGQTCWNQERRMQGHLDSPLTEKGIKQARSLDLLLAREPLAAVWSSDLGRCLDTARLVLGARHPSPDLPFTTDVRLRELCLGGDARIDP